ncbi:MAG: hypothetical protein GQ567_02985 [Methanosarcinales archaeon]|nr:hypothetical protein [Methanosarcinales archaeon]
MGIRTVITTTVLLLALITISTTTAAALSCDYGDICVNETDWWRDGGALNVSTTPIQVAADNATAGETICAPEESYSENPDIETSHLTLAGEGAADTKAPQTELPEGVPTDWWTSVQEDIRKSEYDVTWQETQPPDINAAYQAPNRAHNLRTYFTPDNIRITPRTSTDWVFGLSLVGYGFADDVRPVSEAEMSVLGNRVEYQRGCLTEWYENSEDGLEQGFTIDAPPESESQGPEQESWIAIKMDILGDLDANMNSASDAVELTTTGGVGVLYYGKLHAFDATGRELDARFALSESEIEILVNTSGAAYPITIDPLAQSPAWTAEGNQDGARFGVSVASAGDVNGDGYSDVIVGAYRYDNGQNDEGRAYVYHGSATGLSTSFAWTAEGNQDGANFGASVASAGDVNGDGYSDVIVGARYYDNGENMEGRAYVYHGSATGLSTSSAWTAESNQDYANFGYSVASAGDVNGDGYSDVIVGAWLYDNGETDEGRAYVYHGSAAGLSTSSAWTAESNQDYALFGCSVASAGDVNGDGYSDVIVGAHFFFGRAYVYHGSATGLSTSSAWTAESKTTDGHCGWSVASAGDVNGDGYSDVIVGAIYHSHDPSDDGRVFVYHGNGGSGLSLIPAQRKSDNSAPIAHLGRSDSMHEFRLTALGRTPYGRSKVKLEWEVKPLGTPFDGTGTQKSASWTDTGTAGANLNELVSSLTEDTCYHWRMRLLYHPASMPLQQHSRWLSSPWNGPEETDLRTPSQANYIPPDPINLAHTTGEFWVNYTWSAGSGNVTDRYNVSLNGTWNNETANTFVNTSVGPSGWANITVFAFNASGTGTLSEGSVSDNVQAPAAPEQNYIPPDPTNLQNVTSNYWVNYTWSPGSGNVTDSYNVSLNGTWTNGTTDTFMNTPVGPSGWANITVFAYNASGTGTLSEGSVSDEVQAPAVTPPVIVITTPESNGIYTVGMKLNFSATDDENGVASIAGNLTNSSGVSQDVDSGDEPDVGVYTLVVTATDNAGNTNESDPVFFVVYDPAGGRATGKGWFYPDVESTHPGGKADFKFTTSYKKDVSTGKLDFKDKDADIKLKGKSIDWLVISSVSAQFQGTGTINGEGLYTFRVQAKDNGKPGAGNDHFDIMIWNGIDTMADPDYKAKNTIADGDIKVHAK